MTAVFITVYRQRTQAKIYEERSVQGQINQIIIFRQRQYLVLRTSRECLEYVRAAA